jgi:hypothetical protein
MPCADEANCSRNLGRGEALRFVVTFNGRGFDVPFIYLRSALLNVPISKKNWLGYRYATEPHCDLAEQLTFYSVSGRDGAARRFNLDFYCKAFGIESPKSHGVTGMDVKDADGRKANSGRSPNTACATSAPPWSFTKSGRKGWRG